MYPDRLIPAKGSDDLYVQGKCWQPLRAAKDVGDLHFMIVHHGSQMIRRQSIGFYDDIIVQVLIFDRNITTNMVVCGRRSVLWHFEADCVFFPCSHSARGFIRLKLPAQAIISDTLHFPRLLLLSHLLQTFGRAETGVGVALLDQFAGVLLINIPSLSLPVRAVTSTMVGAFIWCDAQPFQAAHNDLFGSRYETTLVCILNAQNKLSTSLTGDQIGIEGIPCIGEMKSACR